MKIFARMVHFLPILWFGGIFSWNLFVSWPFRKCCHFFFLEVSFSFCLSDYNVLNFCLKILYMEKKILHSRVLFSFFFSRQILPIYNFMICSFSMTVCDMPSAFLDFEALYLRAYWLGVLIVLKTCTARLRITKTQLICQEVVSGKEPDTLSIRANRRLWLALVPCIYFSMHYLLVW